MKESIEESLLQYGFILKNDELEQKIYEMPESKSMKVSVIIDNGYFVLFQGADDKFFFNSQISVSFKYFHELQRIYACITKKELTLT